MTNDVTRDASKHEGPLTNEERVDIQEQIYYAKGGCDGEDMLVKALLRVLDVEKYWREVVKALPMLSEENDMFAIYNECPCCDVMSRNDDPIQHKPDCPWVLAQS